MTNTTINSADSVKSNLPKTERNHQSLHSSGAVRMLSVMVFLLLAAPKLRLMIGPAPLYVIDILIVFLLLSVNRMSFVNGSALKPFSTLVSFYLIFIWFGELRGMAIYGKVLESLYMMGQFTLGVSLFFIVPRIVQNTETMAMVLKAIVIGLICCSAVTIMYALAPTREIVMNTLFSYDFLVPHGEASAIKTLKLGGLTEAMRGQSLIGTSTITTGFLGTMWAFSFLADRWPGVDRKWRSTALIASISTPVAMLMTYGRAAWLTVVVIVGVALIFGFVKSRRNMVILVIGLAIIFFRVGWQSELFMTERVVQKTQLTLKDPYEDKSFAPRLLSFTQPFSHLLKHPIWFITGAGRVGKKLSYRMNIEAKLRDQAGLSKHSGFGMAYYCYGMLAAITHVLIMFNGIKLILKRLWKTPPKEIPLYKFTWQAFLMVWIGLLFWWLPGHAMIGEARGVILFFFFYGLMMACDRIMVAQTDEGSSNETNGSNPSF